MSACVVSRLGSGPRAHLTLEIETCDRQLVELEVYASELYELLDELCMNDCPHGGEL